MNKRCLIFNSENIKNIDLKRYSFIIGVEKGSTTLIKNKIKATHISDFDSISKKELDLIKKSNNEIIVLEKEKSHTDLEEAIIFATQTYKTTEIEIIIETNSNRLDHINILTRIALKYPYIQIRFNGSLILSMAKGKNTIFTKGSIDNKYFGIFANEGTKINITGSKYDVKNFVIDRNTSTQLVSNEILDNSLKIDSTDSIVVIFSDD